MSIQYARKRETIAEELSKHQADTVALEQALPTLAKINPAQAITRRISSKVEAEVPGVYCRITHPYSFVTYFQIQARQGGSYDTAPNWTIGDGTHEVNTAGELYEAAKADLERRKAYEVRRAFILEHYDEMRQAGSEANKQIEAIKAATLARFTDDPDNSYLEDEILWSL